MRIVSSVLAITVSLIMAGCGGQPEGASEAETVKSKKEQLFGKLFNGKCLKIAGTVKLTPEPSGTCSIAQEVPGPTYVGNPDPFGNPACFTLKVGGLLKGTGVAGVTSEAMQFGATATPALISEWPAQPQALTRQVLTARAVLKMFGGKIYSRDVTVIDLASGATTEQLVITGGTGLWKGVKGSMAVIGNSIGHTVPLVGELCW